MTTFVIVAALLTAGAILFVVPPLVTAPRRSRGNTPSEVNAAVYRDQLAELGSDLRAGTLEADRYEMARRELEARLLQDVGVQSEKQETSAGGRWPAIAVGVAVPILAIGLYVAVGNPQGLSRDAVTARGPAHPLDETQIGIMVERLAERLKALPDDAGGWVMLARSYVVLGRFGDAAQAYANAIARLPNDAQLLADYADTLAMAQGRRFEGAPEQIIARALEIDPDNVKALALAGTAAFNKKDYASAMRRWERLLAVAPADSDLARSIRASISQASALSGGSSHKDNAEPSPPAVERRVTGVVQLAPQLAAKVAPSDVVFIYVSAAEGPRAPLAVLRKSARELPAQFALDDSMAMVPDMTLSKFPKVVLSARVSRSGSAQPQTGDLQGRTPAIGNTASGVKILIDSEVR